MEQEQRVTINYYEELSSLLELKQRELERFEVCLRQWEESLNWRFSQQRRKRFTLLDILAFLCYGVGLSAYVIKFQLHPLWFTILGAVFTIAEVVISSRSEKPN